MITTVRKTDKSMRDLAVRLYGELSANQLKEATEALLRANPQLKVRGRLGEGTMVVVPSTVSGLTLVKAAPDEAPVRQVLALVDKEMETYAQALAASIEAAKAHDEQIVAQLKSAGVSKLRSSDILKPHFGKVEQELKQHAKDLDVLARDIKEMSKQAASDLKELSDRFD
jgi:hypothetical protein